MEGTGHNSGGGKVLGVHAVERLKVVEALGLQVLSSSVITNKAVLVEGQPVALVRPDLNEHDRTEVLDWLLDRALHRTLQASQ